MCMQMCVALAGWRGRGAHLLEVLQHAQVRLRDDLAQVVVGPQHRGPEGGQAQQVAAALCVDGLPPLVVIRLDLQHLDARLLVHLEVGVRGVGCVGVQGWGDDDGNVCLSMYKYVGHWHG